MKTPHLLLLLCIVTLSLSGCVYPDPYYGGYYGGGYYGAYDVPYYGSYYRGYYSPYYRGYSVAVPQLQLGYSYNVAPRYYHGSYGHHSHHHH